MDLSTLSAVGPEQLRPLLVPFLTQYVGEETVCEEVRTAMSAEIAGLTDADLTEMVQHMSRLGEEYRLYESDPSAQRIARRWADVLLETPTVVGLEHLAGAVAQGPTVVFSNHQSYYDTSILEWGLISEGRVDLADKLTVIAGPKVYSDLFRRFAAASMRTIQVPQSTTLGHTEQMSGRELARRAISSLKAARGALESGGFLVLYPEGSRTRTGRMQAFLKAVYRYSELVECRVVPATILGADAIMPVDSKVMYRAPTTLTFGPSFVVGKKGGRAALERVREEITSLLPEERRPDPELPSFV